MDCQCGNLFKCEICFLTLFQREVDRVTARQLSEMKSRQHLLDHFRASQGISPDTLLVQRAGTILLANDAAHDIAEAARGTLLGQQLAELTCMTMDAKQAHLRYLASRRKFAFDLTTVREPSTEAVFRVSCLSYRFAMAGQLVSLMRVRRGERV